MAQHSSSNSIGTPFIEQQSVDSTNNYARSLLHEGMAVHGTTVFAHHQSAGKGQRGKVWYSEVDANITLSILVNPQPLRLWQQFELNACTAVAVHGFFEKYAGNDVKIKWPNDLYFKDRKAGGILIENVVTGNTEVQRPTFFPDRQATNSIQYSTTDRQEPWPWAIIGIGININQTHFPDELPNPVSLKMITGKSYEALPMAKELCGYIEKYFQQLITGNFESVYAHYLTHLYKKNEKVRLKKNNRVFEAVIKTVSSSGKLIVQHAIEEEIDFGEVEWL